MIALLTALGSMSLAPWPNGCTLPQPPGGAAGIRVPAESRMSGRALSGVAVSPSAL